jgi:hypothetical protein
MELLLNLLWLALAFPAFWMWRNEPVFLENCRGLRRVRPFVLLGCILMLLFPVVSATDDLQAMRQEIEESSASRVVRSGGEKSHPGLSNTGSLPALINSSWSGPDHDICCRVAIAPTQFLGQVRLLNRSSRAPPSPSFRVCAEFVA